MHGVYGELDRPHQILGAELTSVASPAGGELLAITYRRTFSLVRAPNENFRMYSSADERSAPALRSAEV